jgi:hypothetical protein
MSKRVYKFTSAKYGILNLESRRLKLSNLDDLNDPFDVFNSIDTTNPHIAQAVAAMSVHFRGRIGMLCFSRNWDNLLLWSHYGESHRGLCLGFDIRDNSSEAGVYMDVLYQPNLMKIRDPRDINQDLAFRLLSTKHESWSYEQEVRIFVQINDPPDEGRSYAQFGPHLQLREVIIGAECDPDRADDVCRVLKGYPDQVDCTWSYMRSDAFLLVRDRISHRDRFSAVGAARPLKIEDIEGGGEGGG